MPWQLIAVIAAGMLAGMVAWVCWSTLRRHLMKELVRNTLLTLVILTLIMTVVVVLEPLRKRGLGAEQALALFAFTMPGVLSLTLPIASLFAATFVYGRFAQDNELLACRASGLATMSILHPALVLGTLVTVLTLILSNFVAPTLAEMGAQAAESSLRSIIFHRIETEGYFHQGTWLLYADKVDSEDNRLIGVVAADMRRPETVRLGAASTSTIDFQKYGSRMYATVSLEDAVVTETGSGDVYRIRQVRFESPPLPSLVHQIKEKPSAYSWSRLMSTLKDPSGSTTIRNQLMEIQQDILHNAAVREVAEAVRSDESYWLSSGRERIEISAPAAQLVATDRVELLTGMGRDGEPQSVQVKLHRDGVLKRTYSADLATVEASWSPFADESFLSVKLSGNVKARSAGESPDESLRRSDWRIGRLAIPDTVSRQAQTISLEELARAPRRYTQDRNIIRDVQNLKGYGIRRLIDDILAELHSRFSYGLGCFLMVAMGAALGLMFRGGQVVVAFALAAIPGATVGLLIMTGKQMLTNPDVSAIAGISIIWLGPALLLGANAVLYATHMRR